MHVGLIGKMTADIRVSGDAPAVRPPRQVGDDARLLQYVVAKDPARQRYLDHRVWTATRAWRVALTAGGRKQAITRADRSLPASFATVFTEPVGGHGCLVATR